MLEKLKLVVVAFIVRHPLLFAVDAALVSIAAASVAIAVTQ